MAQAKDITGIVTFTGVVDASMQAAAKNVRSMLGSISKAYSNIAVEQQRLNSLSKTYATLRNKASGALSRERLQGAATKTATAVSNAAPAAIEKLTAVNQQTAKENRLAATVNINPAQFAAWSGLARQAGLDAGKMQSMFKKLDSSVTTAEAATAGDGGKKGTEVTKALATLNIKLSDLKSKSAEEQMLAVAEAIKGADDQQKALQAAETLMGKTATTMFAEIGTHKQNVGELIAQQQQLNVLSNEGRKGATSFNQAMTNFKTVTDSAMAEISGQLGTALAPIVTGAAMALASWITDNKDAIASFATGIGSAVTGIINLLGGFENTITVVTGLVGLKATAGFFSFASSILQVNGASGGMLNKLGSMSGLLSTGASVISKMTFAVLGLGKALLVNPIFWIPAAIVAVVAVVWRLISAWDKLKAAFNSGGVFKAAKVFLGFGGDDEEEEKEAPKKKISRPVTANSNTYYRAPASTGPESYRTATPSPQAVAYERGKTADTNAAALQDTNAAATTPAAGGAQSKQVTVQYSCGDIIIRTHEGMDAKAIAQEVKAILDEQHQENQSSAQYDN